MQLPWNVFFVLSADTSGHDSGTGLSIFLGFVLPSILIYLLYFSLRLVYLKKLHKKINEKLMLLVSALLFVFSISFLFISNHGPKYFSIFSTVNKEAESSLFYQEEFINPESVTLSSKDKTHNLIYIFLESMESSFADVENGGVMKENLIPYLTKLGKENYSFGSTSSLGGNANLNGCCWTAAGLLSKTLSLPYFLPFSTNENGETTCLSKTKSLYDFLADQGYVNIFAMGSEKQFENRACILENHSVEIHDINWYKKNEWLDKDYQVFWGFEDQKLYNFAKKELLELSSSGKPFSFSMLTVDSHFPNGYKCDLCEDQHKSQIENVISCADKQLFDFISWIKSQPFFEDTTIVITGDHAYLDAPLNNFILKNTSLSRKEASSNRKVLDIFINPLNVKDNLNKNRKLSSYDYMPSILNAIGFEFDKKGISLGRSLFGEEETLLEKYGVIELESQTMKRTLQYESLK